MNERTMPSHPNTRPVWLLLAAALLLGAGGCDSLLNDDQPLPDEARLTIEGSASAPLQLITSVNFLRVLDPETGFTVIQLVEADTVSVDLPFEQVYTLFDPANRFLMRVTNEEESDATVTVQVFFDDGNPAYDRTATLMTGQSLEFSQVFFGT